MEQINQIRLRLVNGPDTKPAEAAMQEMGELLGLLSTRPESAKEFGTGPDVLWRCPEISTIASGAAIELKTDKKPKSMYTKKDDIGQFQDHVNFLTTRFPKEKFLLRIAGPRLQVSPESHPPLALRIVEVEQFQNVADRAKIVFECLMGSDGSESIATTAERWLVRCGLNWPNVILSLESDLATDLQSLTPDGI